DDADARPTLDDDRHPSNRCAPNDPSQMEFERAGQQTTGYAAALTLADRDPHARLETSVVVARLLWCLDALCVDPSGSGRLVALSLIGRAGLQLGNRGRTATSLPLLSTVVAPAALAGRAQSYFIERIGEG